MVEKIWQFRGPYLGLDSRSGTQNVPDIRPHLPPMRFLAIWSTFASPKSLRECSGGLPRYWPEFMIVHFGPVQELIRENRSAPRLYSTVRR
ncbi:conserved hypothetical protein [Coccidioides posadasii str. Silveira]|uniref:Uncharacterized protein n=1 Tax=Coccidioides posadasii (strain RMSCC 757 / Silveira) TaxID=443226 RepID=E9D9X7_COCPS|nr:conserved hypothetical protein [Coccidioides posadasii str. Silveira]